MTDRSVLGIDAAWTASQPSGVALAAERAGHWELLAVAPSYVDFVATADATLARSVRPKGSPVDAKALINTASAHAGARPDLVAVDMPLAHTPITTRRASDNAVSQLYGARWCSTHTPSAVRPGAIGEALASAFIAEGYPLTTQQIEGPSLIEVYPHPALVELAGADKRLPYKAQKVRSYWPDLAPSDRRRALIETWTQIVNLLDREIVDVRAHLPSVDDVARGSTIKAFEDMLDAVVCVWIGITVLEGRATPHGDAESAIWIPNPITK
jgi:predicted RNase H-like nuclease